MNAQPLPASCRARPIETIPDPRTAPSAEALAETRTLRFQVALVSARALVGETRRTARTRLKEWGLLELADSACVVISELLTNAVLHACGPGSSEAITLSVAHPAGSRKVYIEVHDPSAGKAFLRAAHPTAESGRGLRLVDALSSAWGYKPAQGGGKTVWSLIEETAA